VAKNAIISVMDNQNPYDFILDPAKGKPAGPVFLRDPKKQMMAIVMLVVGVLLFVVIAFAIFSSLGKKNTSVIVDVDAYQTEIVRISEIGLTGSLDSSIRTQLSTLNTFMQSDLSQTNAYLVSEGKEITELESASKLDAKVEATLASASLKNTYDKELIDIIESTIADYKVTLQKALDSASSEKEKAIFESAAFNILTFEKP